MEDYSKSLEEIPDDDAASFERAALETRAMALVLSGAIPPFIDLVETCKTVQLILDNPVSLFPQRH